MNRTQKRKIERNLRSKNRRGKQEKNVWLSDYELDIVLSRRTGVKYKYEHLLKKTVRVSKETLLNLNQYSIDLEYNRNFSDIGIELIQNNNSDWDITPLMFHDFKHLCLTETHFRCIVSPVVPIPQIEYLFLDVPLEFVSITRDQQIEVILK